MNVRKFACTSNLIQKNIETSILPTGESATVFDTPSLDFASPRLWWIVAFLELVDEQLLVQKLPFAVLLSSHRFLKSAPPVCGSVQSFSIILEIVGTLRIGFQHDDKIGIHFFAGRPPLLGLAASSLL